MMAITVFDGIYCLATAPSFSLISLWLRTRNWCFSHYENQSRLFFLLNSSLSSSNVRSWRFTFGCVFAYAAPKKMGSALAFASIFNNASLGSSFVSMPDDDFPRPSITYCVKKKELLLALVPLVGFSGILDLMGSFLISAFNLRSSTGFCYWENIHPMLVKWVDTTKERTKTNETHTNLIHP